MLYSIVEVVADLSVIDLSLFIAAFTATFLALLEVLATIWVIAELRVRLHQLKVRRRHQEVELARSEQQLSSLHSHVVTSPSHPVVRRRTRVFRNANEGHYWNE